MRYQRKPFGLFLHRADTDRLLLGLNLVDDLIAKLQYVGRRCRPSLNSAAAYGVRNAQTKKTRQLFAKIKARQIFRRADT